MADNTSRRFVELRDEAFSASQSAHNRMRHELAIFNNRRGAYRKGEMVLDNIPLTNKSLNPEIQKGIHRLRPAFKEQTTRIEIEPDRSRNSAEERESINDIDQWVQMMQDVDSEGTRMDTGIYHNLVFGHNIRKVLYDPYFQVVRCININPLTFAPDPAATMPNLHNAEYTVQTNYGRERYIKRHYPEYQFETKSYSMAGVTPYTTRICSAYALMRNGSADRLLRIWGLKLNLPKLKCLRLH